MEMPLPDTVEGAARWLLGGVLIFAFGFESVVMLWEGKFLFSLCSLLIAGALTLLLVYWSLLPTIILILSGVVAFASIPLVFYGIVRFIRDRRASKHMLMAVATFLIAVALIAAIAGGALFYVAKTTETNQPKTVLIHDPATAEDITKATAAIQAERDSAVSNLATTSRERDELKRQNDALRQAAASQSSPGLPSRPQFFDPGPALQRKFIRKEAETMIEALSDLIEAVNPTGNLILSMEKFHEPAQQRGPMGRRFGLRWNEVIQKEGINEAIESLADFQTKLKAVVKSIDDAINKYPPFVSDLRRILGRTNVEALLTATQAYIVRLGELRDSAQGQVYPPQIVFYAAENVQRNFAATLWNVQLWSQTFINSRAPDARKEIEAFL